MMKLLLPLLLGIFSSVTYANENCDTHYDDKKVLSWTGVCKDGRLDGIGELISETVLKDKSRGKTAQIGRYYSGEIKGLSLETPDGYQLTFVRFWQNNKVDLVGPFFITDDSNRQLPIFKRKWFDTNENDKPISYEGALEKIRTYIATKNELGMSYEILKGYFEGRIRVNGEDAPPALGAALKPSGGKKMKK